MKSREECITKEKKKVYNTKVSKESKESNGDLNKRRECGSERVRKWRAKLKESSDKLEKYRQHSAKYARDKRSDKR